MTQRNFQICNTTVLDTTYPGITFDENGNCSLVEYFQNIVKPNWHHLSEGDKKLDKVIERIKSDGKNKEFDSILGMSGGADSSYMLHKLVNDYGLRPLVFHVDGGWNSDISTKNIHSLVNKLKVDLFTEVINWEEMRDFQLAMFKSGVPHLDIPQDMAFVSVLYKYANKHNIKYIFNGGNIATECVARPLKYIYWGTDMRHINDILSKYGTIKLDTFPFINPIYSKFYLKYFKNINVIKPLNYLEYNKSDCMKKLKEIYDWTPYPQKHFESRFTRFFESYWLTERFNFDMRKVDLSSLILTNQLTRKEALNQLKNKPYTDVEIINDKEFIANKLNITVEKLNEYFQMQKYFYYNYKNSNKIFLLGEKILNKLTGTRRGGAF
ncbi:N-acetyl sugar amidotransferase [Verrucomicrobia bacterium]|nr:N-acetyl sugar amidotransferase [Verrucomicrobiota bacterium]